MAPERNGRYMAMTPAGAVLVGFPDEEPNTFEGEPLAVECLQNLMRERTDRFGQTIDPATVGPFDFYFFCRSEERGVSIYPPADDLIEIDAFEREE